MEFFKLNILADVASNLDKESSSNNNNNCVFFDRDNPKTQSDQETGVVFGNPPTMKNDQETGVVLGNPCSKLDMLANVALNLDVGSNNYNYSGYFDLHDRNPKTQNDQEKAVVFGNPPRMKNDHWALLVRRKQRSTTVRRKPRLLLLQATTTTLSSSEEDEDERVYYEPSSVLLPIKKRKRREEDEEEYLGISNEEEKKKRRKITNNNRPRPEPEAVLPSGLAKGIQMMGGEDLRFVMEKELSATDVKKNNNRLSILRKDVEKAGFLREEEKERLKEREEKCKRRLKGIKVLVFDESMSNYYHLSLREWPMGNTTVFNLVTNWYSFLHHNRLQQNDIVRLWSFRLQSHLCFVVLKLGSNSNR
ncbi:B3 domain-containing protein [Trema orientale]|uniref:B3 domain-containing protein n=1 Tax=Trema orientale TaxID=63057 RepID=A0A2P5FUL9_TREOI|nr:B3 domain-containing protein [Trema orientale]